MKVIIVGEVPYHHLMEKNLFLEKVESPHHKVS
jgi:hypothetical protein